MDQSYTTGDLSRAFGIHRRKIVQYEERNIIQPSIEKAVGTGSRHQWSRGDAIMLALVRHLGFLGTDFLQAVMSGMPNQIALNDLALMVNIPALEGLFMHKMGRGLHLPPEYTAERWGQFCKTIPDGYFSKAEREKILIEIAKVWPIHIYVDLDRMRRWVDVQLKSV